MSFSSLTVGQSPFLGARVPQAVRTPAKSPRCLRINALSARPDRPKWYPGAQPPPYLDGTMHGDYGFDPLRLGSNNDWLPWFKEAELTNGRWAMTAVPGILAIEALGKADPWWAAGATADKPIPLSWLWIIEIVTFAIIEFKRYENFKKVGESGFLNTAPFDPVGLRSEEMREKEVKNARLAMVAFLGFTSQTAITGLGPIACLKKHLEDPGHNNIFTGKVGKEVTLFTVALSILPFVIDARKTIQGTDGKDDDEFAALSLRK
ncbi:hypothetical protein WJX84_000613 [Apatococcus fuscideae]|uniref:Chlorophyll a-b binding protein, chloroplastic n=1 Tax=Apatococcus fuscideae TaxID=2026836 RepID=A0AAW1TES9_9CHLO